MVGDYIGLAVSNLRRRKLRSWLTMIGIFIGIAAVVSLIGLGEGLREAIVGQFGFLGTDILGVQASGLQYGPPGSGAATPLSNTLVEKIRRVKDVNAAFNRYIQSGTMEFNNRQAVGFAGSVPIGAERKVFEKMVKLEIESGRLLKDGDGKRILLGNDFTKDDIFGKAIKVGDKVLINDISFEVVGIIKRKGSFVFDSIVFVNEDTLLDSLREDDGTTDIISIQVKDEDRIDQVRDDVEKLLRKERKVKEGEEDFSVETPQQMLESLNSTLFAVQLFVTIIAVISLLVGGIGIMNTMYTAVVERTKEIGIMKAIGARNSTIFILFFAESGLLGSVGGLIGISLGLIFAYGLAFIGSLALGSDLIQASVSLNLILGALAFSFILGTFFGVLPALQASKLKPVDALRSVK